MRELLKQMFEKALQRFLQEERETILRGVSEPSLCCRLAMSLEAELARNRLEGYFADTEYNRNGAQVKTIIGDSAQVVTIRCDLIAHSRGRIPAQDNLIAVEMKRMEHLESEKQKDRIRLRAMTKASFDDVWSADGKTLPEHVCGYLLGYYLEINAAEELFLVERYADGELSASSKIPF